MPSGWETIPDLGGDKALMLNLFSGERDKLTQESCVVPVASSASVRCCQRSDAAFTPWLAESGGLAPEE